MQKVNLRSFGSDGRAVGVATRGRGGQVTEEVCETAAGKVEEETEVHLTELVELGNVCVLESIHKSRGLGQRQTAGV